jgi:enoyl-CoA hydratase/carnithine racemase
LPFYRLVEAMINHEKPLIALVNGPAIGVGCTLLGLVDLVIASDQVLLPQSLPYRLSGVFPRSVFYDRFMHRGMFQLYFPSQHWIS